MKNNAGLSMIEVLIGLGVLVTTSLLAASAMNSQITATDQAKISSTKDRILIGIRNLAGNPAALRNSMQAAVNGTAAVNPQLLACAGGNPVSSCQGGTTFPLTLYSPVVSVGTNGAILGVQAITSPVGSQTPLRFNVWGSPCQTGENFCPFFVYTSFQAICAPPQLNSTQLSVGNLTSQNLQPQTTTPCTVADSIEVTYSIQVDPAMASANPALAGLSGPVSGTIATPVVLISGNTSQ